MCLHLSFLLSIEWPCWANTFIRFTSRINGSQLIAISNISSWFHDIYNVRTVFDTCMWHIKCVLSFYLYWIHSNNLFYFIFSVDSNRLLWMDKVPKELCGLYMCVCVYVCLESNRCLNYSNTEFVLCIQYSVFSIWCLQTSNRGTWYWIDYLEWTNNVYVNNGQCPQMKTYKMRHPNGNT